MDATYKIEFFSNWHCGSGLAAGADVDALVVKDQQGLPYVPGRTLKGLLREAATELAEDPDIVYKIFGISGDESKRELSTRIASAFFSNATLPEGEAIVSRKLTPYLFQAFASTAIDDNGIAKDNSLRKIETVVPCTLTGTIRNVPNEGMDLLEKSMAYVKRMGTGRTRGYGRCKMVITKWEETK